MKVRFWGVRGSTPTPQLENMRYGGNTSCVEVRINDQIYIFDCGTGFRNLGKSLIAEYGCQAHLRPRLPLPLPLGPHPGHPFLSAPL